MNNWTSQHERGSSAMIWLIRWIALHLGRRIARLLLYPITLYFLIKARPQRQASRQFLTRVFERPASLFEVAQHFHCFAATILDRVFLLGGRYELFDIRLHNPQCILDRLASGQGFLLFGSHLGSFEVLRGIGLDQAQLPLKVLMYPLHNAVLTQLLDALNPQFRASVISLAAPQPLLAVKEHLDAQGVVGLLADRARPGEAVIYCELLGQMAAFPAGPFNLAAVTGAPIILVFGLYRGGARYDVHFEVLTERVAIARAQRAAQVQQWARRYAERLAYYTRAAPLNWFNFYDFWM
ncbi:lipid A biosynthesis acyltransferase [Rhodoferax sp. 4810]|uniref:Lipid A biosynthesis acyltransferase n=1 Tax=Thiospirillum jenense TaxID=1653858 RepID=A0A839HIY6_9GAMM|nr:lipid A biosynthesis acyltransferase [Thiospirillum jenense]MBB1075409.1 lipid A biosynthesis acyltransferase [Rhodoferax jenense]MBB1126787.1 lipid A biosynthesis acyltransferase [Thiospirillum jenense]